MIIQKVWWRRITNNDLYNIEKPLPPGPKGQLHIDVPNVPALLLFFDYAGPTDPADWPTFEISAKCFKDPNISGNITFRPRPKNTRYDIPQQNPNAEGSERHPAWTSAFGWPRVHGLLHSTEEAAEVLSEAELRIVVLLDSENEYYADFVIGTALPSGWPAELKGIFADTPAGCLDVVTKRGLARVGSTNLDSSKQVNSKTSIEIAKSDQPEPPTHRGIRHPGEDPKEAIRPSSGRQGYGLSAAEKKAVERQAIAMATEHFVNSGFTDIRDVGDHASYDLTMLKNGQIHFVEVKGTTGTGAVVILTRNEVAVHQQYFPHNALVVVSSITLMRGEIPVATGGDLRVISPWEIEQTLLEPMVFEYRLPR
jgi:hypothetical protein